MGRRRRGKPKVHKQRGSVGSQRDAFAEGTSCSNPVEGQGDDGEEATPCAEGEGEGDGAPPQRKRQRVSRAKGRSSESESALRHDKENGSDAECPVVDGIPDRVEPSNGCGTVPLMCCEPVSSSQGDTAMDFSEPSEAVSLNNVSPIKSGPRLQSDLSSPGYDSDSDDDDDLPSVSVSFGTPTHEGLTFDSIVEGAVYWMVYPRYPPWPALAVSKSGSKVGTVQALFFNHKNPGVKGYPVKIRSRTARQFSEVATERDKFMAEKVESHRRYQVFKKHIETAVEDAKLYITRKDELGSSLSPTDLFDSIARRRITEVVRPEGETTPRSVRGLKFFPEESNSECGSESEEDKSEGEEKGEGRLSKAPRMSPAPLVSRLYNFKYCSRFLQRKAVKEALKGIMERSVPSKRHKTFFSGSNSERRAFRNSHLGPLEVLTTVQRERIVERLKGFVLQWKREGDVFPEIGYTFDVLLPEVIVRMIADIEKVPLDTAEDKYCNWHSQVAASTEEDE